MSRASLRFSVVALLVVIVAVLASPTRAAPAGDFDDGVAERACARPRDFAVDVLRWAILRVSERRLCGASTSLARLVDDEDRDVLTRSLAALALGEIACHRPLGRDREGLDGVAVIALERSLEPDVPATLRQAATRALGRARSTESVPLLTPLRDDDDPIVRFLAAQALTRITGTDQFDAPFRDALVAAYIERSAGYRIIPREVTP